MEELGGAIGSLGELVCLFTWDEELAGSFNGARTSADLIRCFS